MDLNQIRSLVTVLAFVVFVAIVVRAWRGSNREGFAEAAALPFHDEQTTLFDVIPTKVRIHDRATALDPGVRRDDGPAATVLARRNAQ